MNTKPTLALIAALSLSGFFAVPEASAFPRTKDKAEMTLEVALVPVDVASTAAGTLSADITRESGVQTTSALTLTLTGLADGTYSLAATKTSDGLSANIGSVTITGGVVVAGPALNFPDGLDPLDIATVTVSDATPTVVLTGTPTLSIALWSFAANVSVTAPETTTVAAPGGGHKPKKIHGHVLIHALIVNDMEMKRKFLLVAHGGPADTELTINFDGVAVGTFTTTKNGKMMVKDLPGPARIAGVEKMTITDSTNTVIAEADFFPELP